MFNLEKRPVIRISQKQSHEYRVGEAKEEFITRLNELTGEEWETVELDGGCVIFQTKLPESEIRSGNAGID